MATMQERLLMRGSRAEHGLASCGSLLLFDTIVYYE